MKNAETDDQYPTQQICKDTKRSQVFRFLVKKATQTRNWTSEGISISQNDFKLSTTAFGVESRKARKTARDSFNHNL